MDFKGITWAGSIYQKFETMCLEVEEVMYEDTVKYVENQVQKVGASVKKFYSEVVQDLHPTSCVDPVKVAAGELSVNPCAHINISKKPKPSIVDSEGELKKKETDDVNHPSPLSPGVLVLKSRPELCSSKSKNLGIHKRPIGIKRISQNNRPPKISSPMTSLLEDGRKKLASNTGSSSLVASDEMNVMPSSGFFVRLDPGEAANENKPTFDALIESTASDKKNSAESTSQKKIDSEFTSSCHGPTKSIDTSVKDISSSRTEVESVGKEGMVSDEENFEMEVLENSEVAEQRVQIFEPVGKSKLEETCVLVEGDMLHFVSEGAEKHKSYKKKIREAISSKLRSTRRQDHCISHYKDLGGKTNAGVEIPTLTMGPDKTNFPAQDSSESDWELL